MKIYIASSWKNQHGVEMLTALLRDKGHEVISWIENNYGEGFAASGLSDFESWMKTEGADRVFKFDTSGATESDLVIYYGPAGKDACAEMGAAWARRVPIIALHAKGEYLGLMRKMVLCWCSRYTEILELVERGNEKVLKYQASPIRDPYAMFPKDVITAFLENNRKLNGEKEPIPHDRFAMMCMCENCVSGREGEL